uniref:hypothetical protein n=1 Tax=Rhodella violacea TaxID=2801 RepID=UPI001FCD7E5B|nr:hypothetical protein MW504_pgp078 [Rhodella violacea]UNJ18098.1 hypothetical protein [Rhodella violacea]
MLFLVKYCKRLLIPFGHDIFYEVSNNEKVKNIAIKLEINPLHFLINYLLKMILVDIGKRLRMKQTHRIQITSCNDTYLKQHFWKKTD